MNSALWTAKTGLDAQHKNIRVISNNLANVNTAGFKRDRADFETLVYEVIQQPGGESSESTNLPSGLLLGTGVKVNATQKIFTNGSQLQTDNPLDVAINGRGFLQVLMPDGNLAYTRAGNLQVDAQGQVVNNKGYPVQPAINLPQGAQSITIGSDGTISAVTDNAAAPVQAGQIELVDFVNPTGLQAIGGNLFVETASSGAPQAGTPGQNGLGQLSQGALESSNVNVVEELVNLIEAQRAYEINSKAISSVDQMLQYINQQL